MLLLLLLVDCSVLEDLVDLSARDLFDKSIDVLLMMSSFIGLVTCFRFIRTSLVLGLVLESSGLLKFILMILLGRLPV